ncbi:hypothetical protein B0J12DRAFT_739643 [Macrophomina phaseolina]|uniref:Uncharacterized protein n=1 Tax=Macrophomina phaseolina TaxID=35725 RepID=A0ABQ8GD93_9PEZI|nr:hypothetical protein B0J12DRAFT_739643 [Macrophomina phaseolina]
MKTTAAAALTLLATSVSAATYEQFPAGGLSCPTGAEGSTETTLAELKAAADSVVGTTPRETSASNLASGKCTSLSLPLYDASIGQATISVVYDEGKDTFYFCSGQGSDQNGDGYPDGCTEL